uniref:Dehydrogenase/reductase 2 n=1 Tax=Catagonus wagneri TaxID=51154 RepID=A0A8C3X2J9_9CETA
LFRATPLVYGGFQARGPIRAVATGLRHSHSNMGSELHLQPTPQIGFAIARRLAQDGAHVVISSRKQENVEQAVATLRGEGLRVTGTVCHMGKAEDRDRLVATVLESCGGVDILVCAPAVNPLVGGVLKSSEQVWDKILTVNVKSPALLLSQLLPYMENRGSGLHSLVPSSSLFICFSLSLLGLTKTLAVELAPKNIRVNCLVPGYIKTDFSQVTFSDIWKQCMECRGRKGKPEDCAGLVSFLCSSDASYINGMNIVVAGFSPSM